MRFAGYEVEKKRLSRPVATRNLNEFAALGKPYAQKLAVVTGRLWKRGSKTRAFIARGI